MATKEDKINCLMWLFPITKESAELLLPDFDTSEYLKKKLTKFKRITQKQ